MTKLIEENLREYLYCMPGSLNQVLYDNDFSIASLNTSNQIRDAFIGLGDDRVRLAAASYLRETKQSIDLGFLGGLVGVVVEFGVAQGTDAFAAYSDGSAAWYDRASSKMLEVKLKGESRVDLDSILLAAKKVSDIAEPSNALPLQPLPGFALISLINVKGIYFGLGQSREMAVDEICGPIVQGALAVRKKILSLS